MRNYLTQYINSQTQIAGLSRTNSRLKEIFNLAYDDNGTIYNLVVDINSTTYNLQVRRF